MAKAGRIFFPLDVNWYDEWGHELTDDAALLWVVAACATKRMLTDGRMTLSQLRRIAPDSLAMEPDRLSAAIDALDACSECPIVRDGQHAVVIRNWTEWNDSAADVEAMSAGGRFGNHVRWHVRKNRPDVDCEFCQNPSLGDIAPESGGESQSREDTEQTQTQTQTQSSPSESEKPSRRRPETAIPSDFAISDAMRDWASTNDYGYLNLVTETQKFTNHALANDRRCRDWAHAWRNWIIGAAERKPKPAVRSESPRQFSAGMQLPYCAECRNYHKPDEPHGEVREVVQLGA